MNVLQKRLFVETLHEDSLYDRGLVRGELLEEALLHKGREWPLSPVLLHLLLGVVRTLGDRTFTVSRWTQTHRIMRWLGYKSGQSTTKL